MQGKFTDELVDTTEINPEIKVNVYTFITL